ncbi:aldose epimerase family protein [uncultured Metabacillus sp.]|uniref:aldose epimerase family protein n=1 Tax=uncultured Metabacillus sp. TaxID=2860135 RepID=UPI00261D7564|nr:aldose epimerase family protein [uncultured Metabacillus sp.]
MNVTENIFGELNAQKVKSFTVRNDNGMEVTWIDYGCIITQIKVPDKKGKIENVVLGFDTLEEYLNTTSFFGSVIGRVAGRIKQSKFDLDGITYHLPKNEGGNHLHGGLNGFHTVIWDSHFEEKSDEVTIKFSHISPDGQEGYPGRLVVTVIYSLNNNNELVITYQGISDKKTLLNLTNHSYFNLSGDLKRNILEHELTIKSDCFLELNESLLPTGKFINVENTPFDLREGKKVLEGIKSDFLQNKLVGGGYDHPFLLNTNFQEEICLVDPASGRKMVVETSSNVTVHNSLKERSSYQHKSIHSRLDVWVAVYLKGIISTP